MVVNVDSMLQQTETLVLDYPNIKVDYIMYLHALELNVYINPGNVFTIIHIFVFVKKLQ